MSAPALSLVSFVTDRGQGGGCATPGPTRLPARRPFPSPHTNFPALPFAGSCLLVITDARRVADLGAAAPAAVYELAGTQLLTSPDSAASKDNRKLIALLKAGRYAAALSVHACIPLRVCVGPSGGGGTYGMRAVQVVGWVALEFANGGGPFEMRKRPLMQLPHKSPRV